MSQAEAERIDFPTDELDLIVEVDTDFLGVLREFFNERFVIGLSFTRLQRVTGEIGTTVIKNGQVRSADCRNALLIVASSFRE